MSTPGIFVFITSIAILIYSGLCLTQRSTMIYSPHNVWHLYYLSWCLSDLYWRVFRLSWGQVWCFLSQEGIYYLSSWCRMSLSVPIYYRCRCKSISFWMEAGRYFCTHLSHWIGNHNETKVLSLSLCYIHRVWKSVSRLETSEEPNDDDVSGYSAYS